MSNLLSYIESLERKRSICLPDFKSGDTINVFIKLKEGEKERVQIFSGIVIQRRHPGGSSETFTVIKFVDGIYVEKIFSVLSPSIEKIQVIRKGKVRRARIFYLRKLRGKATKIKELKSK
jgi:large subunit ribosomal protein L19